MSSVILVVEGAHDASFFGHLLTSQLGYRQLRRLEEVPKLWQKLIPTSYPADKRGTLERVMRIPDFYADQRGNDVGILNAGSDSKLVPQLQTALDLLGVSRFSGIGLALDADHESTARDRFRNVITELSVMNEIGTRNEQDGYPIDLPDTSGAVTATAPRLGIFVFPDNHRQGTLETVLLETAERDHPIIQRGARALINYLSTRQDPYPTLRPQGRRSKALSGIIGNILRPGTSLAVALQQGEWFGRNAIDVPAVRAAEDYLRNLIAT